MVIAKALLYGLLFHGLLISFIGLMGSPGLGSMSPPEEHSNESSSSVEYGRIRTCGGLITSVNRSWQVAVEPGNRPTAPFKAIAPIEPWSATSDAVGDQGDVYLATVAPHDAFWLGFEADEGNIFAITIDLDGRNALNGNLGWSDTLELEPRNFLLVPDQPWFDSIARPERTFEQLIPHFDPETSPTDFTVGGEIRLVVYPIEANALQPMPGQPSEGPEPLYSQENTTSQTEATIHPWRSRSLRSNFQPPHPCARLTFLIVEPKIFENLTGAHLPSDMFDDVGSPPPLPFDPFQAP